MSWDPRDDLDDDGLTPAERRAGSRCRCAGQDRMPGQCPGPHACPMCETDEVPVEDAVYAAFRETCARTAERACLVPPDGGSPTPEEVAVCDEAARQIRALPPPAQRPDTAALAADMAFHIAAFPSFAAAEAGDAHRDTLRRYEDRGRRLVARHNAGAAA